MRGVSTELESQGVAQMVPLFQGEPIQFTNWLNVIENYIKLFKIADDNNKILIAFQVSAGPVNEYIYRYIENTASAKWDDLKLELRKRFHDVTDKMTDKSQALAMLRNIKQKPGESTPVYLTRLLSLTEDAIDEWSPQVARQLIDIFVDGLFDDRLKLSVLRHTG